MKTILLGLVLFFMILSTGHAQQYQPTMPSGQHHRHKFQMHKKFQMLDLSNEQREIIDVVKDEAKTKIIPIKADIQLKRINLKNEMKADEPNREKIMEITEEINDLQLQIKQTVIDEKLKIHSILTSEQRKQLKLSMYQFMKEQQKEK